MAYTAKSINLASSTESFVEVRHAINTFNIEWLKHHTTDDLVLYHYTNLAGIKGILKNRSLWCSHITSLNDPTELQYGKKLIVDNLNSQMEKVIGLANKTISFLKLLIGSFDTQLFDVYVACFCKDNNLLSQWRAYSNRGIGYNLGISFSDGTKISSSSLELSHSEICLRKVIYAKQEQQAFLDEYISLLINAVKKIEPNVIRQQLNAQTIAAGIAADAISPLFELMITFKNEAFKEENEWRLIRILLRPEAKGKINFRENSNELLPYIETFIYEKMNDKLRFPLHSITIGPMLEELKNKAALNLLLSNESAFEHPIKIETSIPIVGSGYLLRNQ